MPNTTIQATVQKLRAKAREWLEDDRDPEFSKTGFVIFYAGVPEGWSGQLTDPKNWRPGCMAVPVIGGTIYESLGGDDDSGGEQWVPTLVIAKLSRCDLGNSMNQADNIPRILSDVAEGTVAVDLERWRQGQELLRLAEEYLNSAIVPGSEVAA